MQRIFMTKVFARFAEKEMLPTAALRNAVGDAARGLIGADLGGGLIKQRVARPGQGKSGGYRTIIVFRVNDRAVFLYGYAKNERENVSAFELRALRRNASLYLEKSIAALAAAADAGTLVELKADD